MIALYTVQFTSLASFAFLAALYFSHARHVGAAQAAQIGVFGMVALATAALAFPASALATAAALVTVALLSGALLVPSILDIAALASEGGARPRDFAEWAILSDDSAGAWPVELTRPNGPDFSPPVPFHAFLASLDAPAQGEDLDALPALAVAARLLDVRRAMFGETDAADESTYLVEAACFLSAAGHGTARARSQETERATPVAAQYPRVTVQTSAPVSAYGETVCA